MFKRLSRRARQIWAGIALLSVEMTIILVLFIIALLVFAYLIRKVIILDKTQVDQRVFTYLKSHVSEGNTDVMQVFTFLGTHIFLIPANLLLIAYFLFVKKEKWYSIKIPAIALSSLGLMFGLKFLFHRERPPIPLLDAASGLSFPSGHALFSVTFYGLLIYIIFKTRNMNKELKWASIVLLLLLILIIGFSRIYLRVHYASDVLAGYCVGFLWLVVAVWVLNNIEKYSERKLAPAIEHAPANLEA